MCTSVFIRDGNGKDAECDSICDLAKYFSCLVPSKHYAYLGKINRMSETCLCQVDVEASAKSSNWSVVEYDQALSWWTVTKPDNSH